MYSVRIKTLIGRDWEEIPVVEDPEARWKQIKETAGTKSVVEITTHRKTKTGTRFTIKEYYCGTADIYKIVAASKRNVPGCCVVTTEDAIRAKEYNPDMYFAMVSTFFGPTDIERQFPPKEVNKKIEKNVWEHLRDADNS